MTKTCRIAVDVFENQLRGSILSCGRKTITPGHLTHGKYARVNTAIFRIPNEQLVKENTLVHQHLKQQRENFHPGTKRIVGEKIK